MKIQQRRVLHLAAGVLKRLEPRQETRVLLVADLELLLCLQQRVGIEQPLQLERRDDGFVACAGTAFLRNGNGSAAKEHDAESG